MVPGRAKQEGEHGEHGADAGEPDASNILLRDDGPADTVEHQDDSDKEYDADVPHVDEVVEVLIGLYVDNTIIGVGETVLQKKVDEVCHEEDDEGNCVAHQPDAAA